MPTHNLRRPREQFCPEWCDVRPHESTATHSGKLFEGRGGMQLRLAIAEIDGERAAALSLELGVINGIPRALHLGMQEARLLAEALATAAAQIEGYLLERCGRCGEPVSAVGDYCAQCSIEEVRMRRRSMHIVVSGPGGAS